MRNTPSTLLWNIASQSSSLPSCTESNPSAPPVAQSPTGAPPSTPSPNNIVRDGNSYSGKDISFGADIVNKDGSLRNRGTVTSLDTSAGYRQDLLELQRNAAERANAPAPAGPAGFETGQTLRQIAQSQDLGPGVKERMAMNSSSGAERRQALSLAAERANLATREGGENFRTGLRNNTAVQGNQQALRIAEMNNATQRENNANTTRTAMRGHELDFEGRMAPLRVQQQQREQISALLRSAGGDPAAAAQTALQAGRPDLAEALSKPVSTMQEQAGKADALTETKRKEAAVGIKGAFNHMDKEGQPKMSEALEAKAYARLLRSNPNFHLEGNSTKRQKMIDDALADEELMARFERPENGGFGSVLPNMNREMLRQDNLPADELLARGKIGAPVGTLRGALSPNLAKRDRLYDPGDGYEAVNMGDLSARALARLEQLQKDAAQRLRQGK